MRSTKCGDLLSRVATSQNSVIAQRVTDKGAASISRNQCGTQGADGLLRIRKSQSCNIGATKLFARHVVPLGWKV